MSRFSRRALLAGLGGGVALSPFVPLLAPAGDAPPVRLVLFYTPHGTIYDRWRPTGTETEFTLGPILSPLSRHQDRLVVLDGIDIDGDSVGAPHTKGSPLLFTASPLLEDKTFSRDDGNGVYYYGWNSGPSIDQVIADELALDLPLRSLELSVRRSSNHPGHRLVYRGPAQPLAPEDDPAVVFGRLFGGSGTEDELAQMRAERRSVLDVVATDLQRLRPSVPTEDRAKLDAHLQAIRELEQGLDIDPTCEGPVLDPDMHPARMTDVPKLLDAHFELLARAFACDLTRIASVQMSVAENDHIVYDWLGVDHEIHHLITHSTTAASLDALTTIYSWYAERLAAFLDRLAAIPEGSGTVLDNTLVVWGSEIGRGWDHTFTNVPFVLAGGAGGAWSTGRYLEYSGVPHNRLLVSAARAMGVPLSSFGGTDRGTGGLTGLL